MADYRTDKKNLINALDYKINEQVIKNGKKIRIAALKIEVLKNYTCGWRCIKDFLNLRMSLDDNLVIEDDNLFYKTKGLNNQ